MIVGPEGGNPDIDIREWEERVADLERIISEEPPPGWTAERCRFEAVFTVSVNMYIEWQDGKRTEFNERAAVVAPNAWARAKQVEMIYFFQGKSGGPIKIGLSVDPVQRANAITYPEPLVILATMPGGRREEAALHSRFAHLRLEREWFEPSDELLALIEEVKDGSFQLQLV